MMKKIPLTLLAIFMGLVLVEGLFQCVYDKNFDLRTNFFPGPYFQKGKCYGFGVPNYKGVMTVHGPSKRVKKLSLDALGNRHSFVSTKEAAQDVVVFGGASQTFGFGLETYDTWPWKVGEISTKPLNVHNYALPGETGALTTLARYQYFSKNTRIHPKVIVLVFYGDFNSYKFPKFSKNRFYSLSRERAIYNGLIMKRSRYGAHILQRAEESVAFFLERIGCLKVRLLSAFEKNSLQKNSGTSVNKDKKKAFDMEGYRRYLLYFFDEAKKTNATLFVVFAPNLVPGDVYINLRRVVEKSPGPIPYIDLHREVSSTWLNGQILDDWHYNEVLAEYIGKRVSESIQPYL